MSGNGRGNMRPASRSPPFLLIGLLVALCILAFNYWNLSSKNGLLSKQLETAQVDFRSMSDKHLVVEKRAVDLSGQLSQASARLSQLQKESAGKDTRIQELTNQQETLKREQDEVTSHLRQCEEQIEATRQEKQQAEDELQRVKGELEAEKQKAAPACDIIGCKDPIRELISAVTRGVGTLPVITALKQGNIDLSQVAADLLQANAEQPPAGGPQQQQQKPVQAAGQAGDQQQQQQQQVVGQDPNVVQMQQMGAAGMLAQRGAGFGDGGNGDGLGNSLLVGQQQQQLPGQAPYNANTFSAANAVNKPQDNLPAASADQGAGVQHEIVPQNLPHQPISDDNNNINVAQEDVNAPDVPEDDIDKQAAANQGVEDLGDGHLQAQLQDLSKNDGGAPVVGDFDGKENMIPGSNNNRMEEQGDGQKEEEDDEDEMDEYDRRDEADNMENKTKGGDAPTQGSKVTETGNDKVQKQSTGVSELLRDSVENRLGSRNPPLADQGNRMNAAQNQETGKEGVKGEQEAEGKTYTGGNQ